MQSTAGNTVENEFSLLETINIVTKWKKQIFVFVLCSILLALIVTVFLPKKYYSSATIYPTNPQLADKNLLFGKNIEALYSIYGSADDLDRLYTMANTNSMYGHIADSFKLVHSGQTAERARENVVAQLKKNISLKKTENGELVIGVWTKDNVLSAAIANAIVFHLNQMHQTIVDDIQKRARYALHDLQSDSIVKDSFQNGLNTNAQLIRELNVAARAVPPPFVILDRALPATKAGKPNFWIILWSTLLASLLFAVLFVTIPHHQKNKTVAGSPGFV